MKKDDLEYKLLYQQQSLEQIRFNQGYLQGIIDVLMLPDTLDRSKILTEEDKQKLQAQAKAQREPSQAEIMGQLRGNKE